MSRDLLDELIADWAQERPELDASAMGIVGRLIQLGRSLEKSAATALNSFDLHYTDLDVLATLRRKGAPYCLTPTQLRESVILTSGAMTASIDRLEAKGLIVRTADVSDRRVRAVKLTTKGKSLINRAIVARFDEAAARTEPLKTTERKQLEQLLRKLVLAYQGQE